MTDGLIGDPGRIVFLESQDCKNLFPLVDIRMFREPT